MGAIAERNVGADGEEIGGEFQKEREEMISITYGDVGRAKTYDEGERTMREEMREEDKDGGEAISRCLALVALFGLIITSGACRRPVPNCPEWALLLGRQQQIECCFLPMSFVNLLFEVSSSSSPPHILQVLPLAPSRLFCGRPKTVTLASNVCGADSNASRLGIAQPHCASSRLLLGVVSPSSSSLYTAKLPTGKPQTRGRGQ